MRFVGMHKVNAHTYAGPPKPELLMAMGQLMGEMAQAGVLVGGEGLRASDTRVRISLAGKRRTVTKGPHAGDNELVARLMLLRVQSMDEAIEWATRYGELVGDAELEIGPVTEAWDLGVAPRPADPPLRCLVLHKADRRSEAGQPLAPSVQTKVAALFAEMEGRGVLLSSVGLMPSTHAARIRHAGGQRSVVDGPFAESKELIAGFALMEVASRDEALTWSNRFAATLGDVELDLVQVA